MVNKQKNNQTLMSNKKNLTHICSLNCQGLGNKEKRLRLKEWVKTQKCDILFIQESHFTEKLETDLKLEFRENIFHSFGSSQARGVSIYIKHNLNYEIIDKYEDKEGRLLILNVEIDENIYTLVNIYAPNDPKSRNSYFREVKKKIDKHLLGALIIGGDMNDILMENDSKSPPKISGKKKPVTNLRKLIKSYKLIDIWRAFNKNKSQFTWRRKHNKNEATRIDYFLICPEIRPHVISTDIRPAAISYTDHQAISLKIGGRNYNRGKGYFKLNNSILEDSDYKELIKKIIKKYEAKTMLTCDQAKIWDLLKAEIREQTIFFCKRKAKQTKNEIDILEKRLNELNQINNEKKDDENLSYEIQTIEQKLEKQYMSKTKGAQIRSRIKWFEEGEKNTKFFLGLEKVRQAKKSINSIKDKEGKIQKDSDKIISVIREFYCDLYTSTDTDIESVKNYIKETKIDHKLTYTDSLSLEGKITIKECEESLYKMNLNRAPGYDGLGVEFYRTFWNEIKHLMINTFNHCYEKGEMSNTQKLGVISLIHKKDNPQEIANYRPITLLNIDTKLMAYTIAQRIKNILPKIINNDQNGYVKNRYIGFNIRQIQDIIDHAEKFNVTGAILFLDFSKAFDSLEWNFMFESLKKFGFTESFLQWIKIMYNDIKSSVTNNGWISAPIKVQRGIRQGCPCSALLFVVAVEILACKIRQDQNIRGFTIKLDGKTHCLKITQLADDTTLFLHSKEEITKALNVIEIFGSFSGLKLNRSKTEGIWLGKLKHSRDKFENVNWKSDPIKSLGIYLGINKIECKTLNFSKMYGKIETTLSNWKKRNLTLIGKITVIKSLIIPQITFLASVSEIEKKEIKKIQTLIYKFIWDNKVEKVKRETLSLELYEGGLKMIDIEKYIDAIKIGWIKKLTTKDSANWKTIPRFYLEKYGKNFLIFSMNIETLNQIPNINEVPSYYKEIIKTWIKYKKKEDIPNNFRKVRQQLLWGNKNITLKKKTLVYKNWIDSDILYINDIIDDKGNISETVILNKLKLKQNYIIEIAKLKNAVPKYWMKEIKSEQSNKSQVKVMKELLLENNNIAISNLTSKNIYKTINNQSKEKPLGFLKWKRIMNLSNSDFENAFKFIHYCLKDNKLIIMRWKIIHYILPCGVLLKQWKLRNTDECKHCKIKEDYEHYFITCRYLENFWVKMNKIIKQIQFGTHLISLKHIIFGYKNAVEEYNSINIFLTIIMFSIYKAYCMTNGKESIIDVYEIFRMEFQNYIFLFNHLKKDKTSNLLHQIENVLKE